MWEYLPRVPLEIDKISTSPVDIQCQHIINKAIKILQRSYNLEESGSDGVDIEADMQDIIALMQIMRPNVTHIDVEQFMEGVRITIDALDELQAFLEQ